MSEEIHSDTRSLHSALFLIADIRRAVGDPTGKLMQDELVAHCGEVYKRAESYSHLVESLPKSKRPFSDKQAQKVIASQVKRITQLEDDLSRANCELDKERKKNAWHGVDTESFVDSVRIEGIAIKRIRKCDNCGEFVDIDKDSSAHGNCNYVWGRRGWRQLGEYDG